MNADGCDVTADHILVTNGAKQGIDLVCRLLLDEGDAIVVTAPTYFTAVPIFRNFGVEFIEVGQDAAGLDVAALDALLVRRDAEGKPPPKFIYNIPDFTNPTGAPMTAARRPARVAPADAHALHNPTDGPAHTVRLTSEEHHHTTAPH